MTEEQIKEMLNGIINNGEKWECIPPFKQEPRGMSAHCWQPYKLGDEIHTDWRYRKVENWSVIEWEDTHKFEIRTLNEAENIIGAFIQITFKTKEECEKWIEENARKTWLKKYLEKTPGASWDEPYNLGRQCGIKAVCKKILEEVDKKVVFKDFENYESGSALCITLDNLEQIIKDLGVEL